MNNPHSVDIFAGERLRTVRKTLGISQSTVASMIGVTFQQLQKYENARNRISVSRLHEICRALNCKPGSFFPKSGPNERKSI